MTFYFCKKKKKHSLNDVMESYVFAVMQSFQLVAHVLEEQAILLRIRLQSALQQSQDKLHLERRICTSYRLFSTLRYQDGEEFSREERTRFTGITPF